MTSTEAAGGRRSRCELRFRRDPAGQTYLAGQHASYPFHVCRLHRYAGDPAGMATLYLQSVSGGIYEHDELEVLVAAEPQASLHLTTQASTIVHPMRNGAAAHAVVVQAGPDSFIEHMPEATILFPEARLTTRLAVEAHETAAVILADSFLAHDPAGANAPFGALEGSIEVRRPGGRLLFADRYRLTGERWTRRLAGVSGPCRAHAMLLVLHPCIAPAALAAAMREAVPASGGSYAGATTLPNGCGAAARILAHDGAALREALLAAWSAVRELATGTRPQNRRK